MVKNQKVCLHYLKRKLSLKQMTDGIKVLNVLTTY